LHAHCSALQCAADSKSFKQFQQVDKGVESAEMEASVAQASVFCFPTSYNPFQTRLQDKTSSAIQACIYIYIYIYTYIYIHIYIYIYNIILVSPYWACLKPCPCSSPATVASELLRRISRYEKHVKTTTSSHQIFVLGKQSRHDV
jgi:hypothetical protein